MKHFKLFFTMLMLIAFNVGNVWGATETATLQITSGVTANGNLTDDQGNTWAVESDGSYTSNNSYIQCGTGTKSVQYIRLTTGAYSSYSISTIQVWGTSKANTNVTAKIYIGSTKIGESSSAYSSQTASSGGTELSANNSTDEKGNITIEISRPSSATGAIYFNKLIVTYDDGGSADPVLESIVISGTPDKDTYEAGEEFNPAGLVATGYYDNSTNADITSSVEWAYTPAGALTQGLTSVNVTATKGTVSSAATPVAITVNAHVITPGEYGILLSNEFWGVATGQQAAGVTSLSGRANDIDFTMTKAGSQMYASATQTRFYSGATLTISAPTGFAISSIVFAEPTTDKRWDGSITADEDAYDGDLKTWAGSANSVTFTFGAQNRIATATVTYEAYVAPTVAMPTISGEENFVGSTSVTLDCSTTGAEIYYTTDGTDPKSGSLYSEPFSLTNDATVKAIAKLGSDWSAVASKEFTKVVSYTTIADIYTKAVEVGSTATDIYVTFNNWIVTGVKNSNVYLTDGTNGLIIYGSGHNFEAGDILSGTAACKVQLYNGNAELTSLTASTAGLTVTKGGVAAVNALDTDGIAALTAKNTGSVIKISGEYTSDGKIAGVKVWNNLYSFSLTVGTSYECTGVYFNGGETHGNEIMPRSADDIVVVAAATLEEVTGLAALKAADRGSYIVNLTDAVVTLVDGNNAFIEDATAGALIYFSGHGYAAGDKLNGQYEVTTSTYQGKFEITAMEAQTGATKVADAEIPVTTMTIAQLNANFAANESKRIKIVGVNVTDAVESGDATARTGEISDGENTITLYAGKSGVTAAENANIDVIGYPTFHNTDQQLAVWAQADITVNVKEDPELAYTPASESIELGDSWSAPTLANPHNLPLSFSSDKEALATVTDAGVIALVADATGTATITASFAGNATYNAGSATYTITVSVPDSRKKATLENIAATSGSFDRTDITYAAYQGDGTTPPAANGTDLRLYKPATGKETGGYIVISAVKGCTIDEVVVTNGDSKATTIGCSTTSTLATSGEAYAKNASVSFESLNSSVVYIDNIGSDRMDIIKIEVYYTGEPASVHHLTLSGTYPTEFEQGDVFDYTGLVVTAAYDEEETDTKDVTSAANVSTPDMNTIGEKTITVSYGGKSTEYTITVNAAAGADDISGVWTLVTDATALEAGMKVIIAQHVDADGAIYTMGDQKSNNRGAVESAVAGSILTPNFKTRVFELEDAGSGMFALKAVEDSKYLYAAASGNNYMKSQESIDDNAKWTITVDADGVASIVATNSSNRNVMQFNSGSSLFSCYGSASQTDIALYTRAKEKREGFTVGKLATVCVPYAVAQEDIIGADVYVIAGKNEAGKIVFDQVTTEGMEAGVAYLVQAKAETATFYYSGNAVAEPQNEGKALKGTFDEIEIAVANAANVYFFKDNALWSAKETGVKILAYRAWLDMSAVGNAGPSPAPGRRRITMDVHGENAATGMDELSASEAPRKMIIDGQLYILRGEKMYNANGILVK